MAQMRLNKIIADAGITSRRGADELIEDGRVAGSVRDRKMHVGGPARGQHDGLHAELLLAQIRHGLGDRRGVADDVDLEQPAQDPTPDLPEED